MAEVEVAAPLEHPLDLETLQTFVFERVLSENTLTGSMFLLGTIHQLPAIVHIQRTLISSSSAGDTVKSGLESFNVFLENRPYFSAHALLRRLEDSVPDLQVKVIWPATDEHIRKHSVQERRMIRETPEIYQNVVVPYIESIPAERTEWVQAILDGRKEASRVLHRNEDSENGFIITPDLKWDETSMNALYIQAIVQTKKIRSIRDLTKAHVPMLKEIRHQAGRAAKSKYGVEAHSLRMFIHYHPSYYHFHVHIVNIYHEGPAGMLVGQAHLLDDVISLLEIWPGPPETAVYAQMTLTFALGVQHKLYPLLQDAVSGLA